MREKGTLSSRVPNRTSVASLAQGPTMEATAPAMAQAPAWFIVGLTMTYIYYRCAPNIAVAHFPMIRRLAVRKHRTERVDLGMVSYAYEYQSQRNRDRAPYQIVIDHHADGLRGSCTCPFYATSAAGTPTPWLGQTWCKHLAAAALLLVDPATRVRDPRTRTWGVHIECCINPLFTLLNTCH
jgi:hypothetical protein